MTDLPSGPSVDPRLRDYLAAELRQAELDFPYLPRPAPRPARRRLPVGIAFAAVTSWRPSSSARGSWPRPGGSCRDPDRDRRSADLDRRGAGAAWRADHRAESDDRVVLAAGRLVRLGPVRGRTRGSPSPCGEWWKLEGASGSGCEFALNGMTAAPGFVRTSGALTVIRVEKFTGSSSGPSLCTGCQAP